MSVFFEKNKNKLLFVFCVFITAFFALYYYFNSLKTNDFDFVSYEVGINQIESFSVNNESSIDLLKLIDIRKDTQLTPLDYKEKINFKKIIITINDINELTPTELEKLNNKTKNSDKKIVRGFLGFVENEKINYQIYLDVNDFKKENEQNNEQTIHYSLFDILFIAKYGSLFDNQDLYKLLKNDITKNPIIDISYEKQSSLLEFFKPKKVFAQSCTGTFSCGQDVVVCGCPNGGSCNSNGEPCITGGTCSCSYTCENDNTCEDCAGRGCTPTEAQCENPQCANGCLVQSENRCDWLAGGGTPQCPPGQIFCGGCISACMPNTQTCNEWIEDQCGEAPPPPPGGGDCTNFPSHLCGAACTNNTSVCGTQLSCNGGTCQSGCCPTGPPPNGCGDICNEADGRFCIGGGLSCNYEIDGDNNPNSGVCWQGSCNGATAEKIMGYNYLDQSASGVTTTEYNNVNYRQNSTPIKAITRRLVDNNNKNYYLSTLVNNPLSVGQTFQTSIVPNPGYRCVGWEVFHTAYEEDIGTLNCGSASPIIGQTGSGCTANFHLCTDGFDGSVNNFVNFIIEQDVEVKTCSASALVGSDGQAEFGDDVQVVVSGTSSLTTPDPTRLWLEKQDYTEIDPEPAGTTEYIVDGRYYYLIESAACNTSNSNTCIDEAQLSGLAVGNYYVHCDIPNDPRSCSGNPVCSYNGMGGPEACTGYYDCDPDPANQNDSSAFSVVCTPSCGNTTCGDTGATPNNITGLTVTAPNFTAGKVDMTNSTNLVVNWDNATIASPASVDFYQVRLWPQSQGATVPEPNSDTCDNTTDCRTVTRPGLASFYTFLPRDWPDQTDEFYVAVRAINNTCTGTGVGNWSSPLAIDLVTTLTGNFYEDDSATTGAGGACTGDTSTAVNLTGSTMTNNRGAVLTSLNTGFTLTQIPFAPSASWPDYGYNIQLDIDNPDPANAYVCACPTGCSYTGLISATNATARNFFLTRYNLSNGPWWQTKGGNVYAKDSISSTIPDTCPAAGVGVCDPYFITQNGTDEYSGGIAITGGNSTSSIAVEGYYTDRDPDTSGNQPRSVDVSHANNQREGYDYFAGLFDIANATTLGSGTLTALPTSGQTFGSDNTEVYTYTGNLTLDFDTTQTVSGKKMVIMVDGNVTIQGTPNTPAIDVANNAFLGVIASGNINIDETIGNTTATATTPVIEGVFVADGDLNIENYADDSIRDLKFVGEGTFVGHTAINLNRDYNNTTNPIDKALNNTNPIEVFVYRPDFVTNIPSVLKQPNLYWQEVN